MWQLIICGCILLVLGLIEAWATLRYAKYDVKTKQVATGPMATYSGAVFSIIFIVLGIGMMLGNTALRLNHIWYIIIGIALIVVAILIFMRGRNISRQLKKNESNVRVVQAYVIAAVILISGIISLFK